MTHISTPPLHVISSSSKVPVSIDGNSVSSDSNVPRWMDDRPAVADLFSAHGISASSSTTFFSQMTQTVVGNNEVNDVPLEAMPLRFALPLYQRLEVRII